MIDWFFATLRQYPEIAIFLALGLGYYFGGFTFKGIGLGSVTATLLAAVIIGQIGITISHAAQGDGLPDVPVRGRLRRRPAVRPRRRRGRLAAGDLLGGPVRVLPGRSRRDRQVGRLRPRLRRRGSSRDRRPSPPRWASPTDAINRLGLPAEQAKALPRLDADRLRGELHLRHRRLGDRDRAGRAGAPPDQSSSRRARSTRRSMAARKEIGRRGLGLAPLGGARVPRPAGREGRRPSSRRRPRRWSPTRASSCCECDATG